MEHPFHVRHGHRTSAMSKRDSNNTESIPLQTTFVWRRWKKKTKKHQNISQMVVSPMKKNKACKESGIIQGKYTFKLVGQKNPIEG
jgi:hypothetical protein